MHLTTCSFECNCYTTTTSTTSQFMTDSGQTGTDRNFHYYQHCETCYYDCFDGGYTVNFTVWGPPKFTNTVDEFVINMEFEQDVWSYLDRNWPIGFTDTCWYHAQHVYHFEWTVRSGLGALIGGIIALVFGVVACAGAFITSSSGNSYGQLKGFA